MYEEMQNTNFVPKTFHALWIADSCTRLMQLFIFFVCQAWVTKFDRQYAYLSVFYKVMLLHIFLHYKL